MRRVLKAIVMGGTLAAAPASAAEFTKGQELTILSARSAYLASENCPYALNGTAMQQVLARKNLTASALFSGSFSPLLQEDLAADVERYKTDTAAACDQAWASFGPAGPLKGLLRAK